MAIREPASFPARAAAALLAGASLLAGPAAAQDTAAPTAEPAPAGEPSFFFFTDNSISLLPYGQGFEVDPDEQWTVTFEHAHASRIGDLFMFVDFNNFHDAPGGVDNNTWYGEFGPRLSFGKIFGKDLSHTLFKRSLFEIKDVLLAIQYERGEDPDVAEAALVGIGFDLDVRGAGLLGHLGKFNYVQLNLYARSELTESADNGFHDAQLTMVASYPFQIGEQKFLIDGYFDWVLGIGGDEDWSYHLNPQITWDAAAGAGHPGKFFIGLEVDFWWNKYQIPDSSGFDTNQAAVSLLMKYHF